MQVIGLCGPEGAGKSTAAAILHKSGFYVVPFAKPLKDMLRVLGVPEACLTGKPEQKESPLALFNGKSARHAMQTLGTEWGRECICSDFWARAWRSSIERTLSAHKLNELKNVVADDVRFPQEVEAVRRLGGRVICIVRSDDDFDRVPKHPSEDFAKLPFDMILKNDGNVAELAEKLMAAVAIFKREADRVYG